MTTGIPFSIYYEHDDITAILISAAITIFSGTILWFFTRDAERHQIAKRDGYLTVTLAYLLIVVFGTLPFIIYGGIPSFTDAFF